MQSALAQLVAHRVLESIDDLVLAVAMASWYGEHVLKSQPWVGDVIAAMTEELQPW